MATPLYCRKCGTRLPPESPFCPTCGASQSSSDHTPTNLSLPELSDKGTGRLPAGRMLHQRYRLLQAVGQGGMGAVYIAQDAQLGDRLVAVKEMGMSRLTPQELPQAVEQFQREAHLLASLHHPNLPVIYDYFGEDERWYLVMSFIEGGTLQASLDTAPGKRLPVNEVVRIGIELCDVLDYLHTHQPQVIFRDLKPLNIMLTPKGHVCLIDFGIARHFKPEQTKDTAHYYSVGYAPPEQYGQSQTGPRSDIYSLGATLHQMLSGRHPASGPFQFPALQLVNPTIPVPFAKLIAQMLEMDEQARPASAAEVKAQLERVLTSGQIEATRKVDYEKKEKVRIEKEGAEKKVRIDSFFGKRRILGILAWICFIVLSLGIGLGIGNSIIQFDNGLPSAGIWLLVAGIGAAVVGLTFLLVKGRFLVDIFGGIALAVLGDLALLACLSDIVSSTYTYVVFIPILNIILLLVGTRFFLRSANMIGGFIFGVLLIVAGILVSASINTHFNSYGISNILVAPFIIWVPSFVLGVVAIIVTFLKRRRNKRRVQSQTS